MTVTLTKQDPVFKPFIQQMEHEFKANSYKPHWTGYTPQDIFYDLVEHVEKLGQSLGIQMSYDYEPRSRLGMGDPKEYSADIALGAMFIFDLITNPER